MRTLLLLRGVMGAGKSTWVKENHLENYTLSADDFRLKVCNPILNTEGEFRISQKFDTVAWNMLMQCLEERMKMGHFTVIDATHNNRELVRKYEKLAEKYRYQIYYKQFDVPLETCLARNATRDEFKRVPEEHLRRAHMLIQETTFPKKFIRIEELSEIENYFLAKPQERGFNEVKVIGDIHGCYTVMNDALGGLKEDTLYIFLGDILDRGIENKQVIDWFIKHREDKNAIFIEGNHEAHWVAWARDEQVYSKSFLRHTLPELIGEYRDRRYNRLLEQGIDLTNIPEDGFDAETNEIIAKETEKMKEEMIPFKKDLRQLHRRFRTCYFFEFNGQKYFCSHGGLSALPKLTYVSAREMINGVGSYETEIDEAYELSYQLGNCQDAIQFHGHRNTVSTEHSYCLEDSVEFGGNLCIATINQDGVRIDRYENKVFKEKPLYGFEVSVENPEEIKYQFDNPELNALVNSRDVNVKELNDDIISVNFKNSVFRKASWNHKNIKARGLFLDKNDGHVVIRSYNKFFNLGEITGLTDLRSLKENLQYPVRAYVKENGYLGLVSIHNGEWIFASKSTTVGPFADWLRELFDKEENLQFKHKLKALLERENATAVFEVVLSKDRHMVDYRNEDQLILLDIVKNELTLHGCNVDDEYSQTMLDELFTEDMTSFTVIRRKMLDGILSNYDDVIAYIDELNSMENVEGAVLVDATGFCFKLKGQWYSDWKRRRNLVQYYISHRNGSNAFKYQLCRDEEDIRFMKFVTSLPEEQLELFRGEYLEAYRMSTNNNDAVSWMRAYQKYLGEK